MSGGRATVIRARGGKNRQGGDISAVAPEGHALTDFVFIECKHVRSISLEAFIIKGAGPIAKWWKEARKQAKQHGREPVLIMKQNFSPVLILTKPNSALNLRPVAHLTGCHLGLLERTLATRFEGVKPIPKRTVLQFPGDPDLELR